MPSLVDWYGSRGCTLLRSLFRAFTHPITDARRNSHRFDELRVTSLTSRVPKGTNERQRSMVLKGMCAISLY
ncbi:hypothetical protein HETIRDRAFT_328763 [Heterobasidion irregulare TC 32-1]|uniref:Uncharacterized protein n=1 Tax=Heterobasidion irregulare (strain TC 32-1) TaxID=747525 RepID=W4JU16_HETIT|nr:uncharacterized protein HETIRDRAFT_328763 [Heterobasidion irregulare TC 32-1]ETW76949.1 hypothetical protein HETIRDRAFT_328763 [Heterobasidion irregulare TC 32-1]